MALNKINFKFCTRGANKCINHNPSEALDALLLLFSNSGGDKKRFGYGAFALVAVPLFVEKHGTALGQIENIDDVKVNGPLLAERDAFSFKDLAFPCIGCCPCTTVDFSSSTISNAFNSNMLLSVTSGRASLMVNSTGAGKFKGSQTLNNPASFAPFLFSFRSLCDLQLNNDAFV